VDASIWGAENITLIIILVIAHFFFWFYLLLIVEKGYFLRLNIKASKKISTEALKLDDDVFNEAVRVH
jgi:hypothetical protein